MSQENVIVSFDMRAPAWGAPRAELYAAALEMARFVDDIGVPRINLMEHHGSDDGYLPQPFLLGAGMAPVTKRVRLMLGAVILPLHDPVMVAEQIAVLDLMSGGRLGVILGAGYVPFEFQMFKASLKERGRKLDEGINVILRALRGERFEADGREVFVRPLPLQRPEDILMAGGGVPASAKRAARFDIGFGPMTGDLVDLYLEECAAFGRPPRQYSRPVPGMPLGIHLAEDPDRAWAVFERHAVHVISEYARWAEQEGGASNSLFRGLTDGAALRRSGIFVVWTPDELARRIASAPPGASFGFHPLLGGLPPEEGWKSLELLKQAMPLFCERAAG